MHVSWGFSNQEARSKALCEAWPQRDHWEDVLLLAVQQSPDVFPPVPPMDHPRFHLTFFFSTDGMDHHQTALLAAASETGKKVCESIGGKRICDLGEHVLWGLLGVVSLCSSPTGMKGFADIFPLPTYRSVVEGILPSLDQKGLCWMQAVCISLNTIWGMGLSIMERPMRPASVASPFWEKMS